MCISNTFVSRKFRQYVSLRSIVCSLHMVGMVKLMDWQCHLFTWSAWWLNSTSSRFHCASCYREKNSFWKIDNTCIVSDDDIHTGSQIGVDILICWIYLNVLYETDIKTFNNTALDDVKDGSWFSIKTFCWSSFTSTNH